MDKRVEKLEQYELLDTMPESEFDDIVDLASAFFGMPISLISLLDSHRQWFKARVGVAVQETPIEIAFCNHAIAKPGEVMVVPDSLLDTRFKNNALAVNDPHVRFYAGAPLVTDDGFALGTLCVIDHQPRTFSPEQKRILQILANKVMERFEARKQHIEQQREIAAANKKIEVNRRVYTKALGETLDTISHKIRKPVATIKGIANQLNTQPETLAECLPYLNAAATELDNYIFELNDSLHDKQSQALS
jgi:GAF domain-containing protein